MPAKTQSADKVDWATLTLEQLLSRQKDLYRQLGDQTEALLALAPVVQRRLREELGWVVEADYSLLTQSLERLVQASVHRPAPVAPTGRRAPAGKPLRYRLVRRDTGAPICDAQGAPLSFRTKLRVLRGPRYEALLGPDGVAAVHLVDTQDNNQVVVEELRLGPAPGGRRKRG